MSSSTSRSNKRRYQSTPSNLPQQKSIACRPCHNRKIKCSGGRPCNNCTRASECVYPTRDRQIKVPQSLLDRLFRENEELRARTQSESPQTQNADSLTLISDDHPDTSGEQILEEIDWFAHTRTSDTPIWIGEISDAAFATRFRQFAFSSQTPSHIPRTQFASDDALRLLATMNPAWPTPPRARLLVQTALQFLWHSYHVVRRSEMLSALNTVCSDPSNVGVSPIAKAKMWALFALGELRSSKCLSSSKGLPGLAYFAVASDTIRMINERPQLDVIETILILTLYSLEANRRHSACTLVGSALRLATVMGLHLNIGDAYVPDPELREHRIRVWWSVYILDRLLSSKIGLPPLISDDDISVDLPSNSPALTSEDFGDHSYFLAVVRLAKIAGNISRSLYVRTPQRGTFLQRVARIQEELDHWKEELPEQMKLDFSRTDETQNHSKSIISRLKVSFNQLFILATRPVLLFCFRRHVDEVTTASKDNSLPDAARDVANACISTARQSCQLLLRCWVNGEFHIFDYSYVQHLFSATVILAIASTLGLDTSTNDRDEFDITAGFLQQLEQNGNPAAMEFYSHIKEIQITLETWRSTYCQPNALPTTQDLGSAEIFQSAMANQPLEAPVLHNTELGIHAADGSPLNLSFLDDWIYDNALQQICWQE
ncbi:fungal-specific transcription factor domain-containing protein [Fusarium redolens]|uniref:Fungal-specific transcription factor domain-containing protein n=1 Tax=Fusarium redolens TaxID=48865 RepID=A0A9P9JPL3_FUSRE|nr:fungal-specific transcription factor domain-containing protein [Fusarium redolens]KAH7203100.1 fungal-specific transcription factor domain-containing protein [Fusarium redolens]